MSLMVYAIGYVAAMAMIAIALTIVGATLPVALSAAGAAVANAGPLLDLAIANEAVSPSQASRHLVDSSSLLANAGAQAALCAGMILGRLEVLAALAMLNPSFWKK